MEQLIDLDAELVSLRDLLFALSDADWTRPTRCDGWDVADVVLHLAQTNEMAAAAAAGRLDEYYASLPTPPRPAESVDDSAAMLVEAERGATPDAVVARWGEAAGAMTSALAAGDPSDRVMWVAGTLARRTLATTRQSETWIHHGDIAEAVGAPSRDEPRLVNVARLAWRTIPYAFTLAGRPDPGPVAMYLAGVAGESWDFVPEAPAVVTVRGSGAHLCAVAARRLDPALADLEVTGPNGSAVLELIRTYA